MQTKVPAGPTTPAKPAGARIDAVREANRRRIYISVRIEELRAELARLIEERKTLKPSKP